MSEATTADVAAEVSVDSAPKPVLDVDVAELSDKRYKGEHPPVILVGYWVKLKAHDDVPDRFVGHIAAVLESPFTSVPFAGDAEETIHGYRYNKDKKFTVRTRDEADARLEVSADAIDSFAQDRNDLLMFA